MMNYLTKFKMCIVIVIFGILSLLFFSDTTQAKNQPVNIDEQVQIEVNKKLEAINKKFDFYMAWTIENYLKALSEFSRKNYGGAIVYFIKATVYIKHITPRFHLAKAITYTMIKQNNNALKEINLAIRMCKADPWNRLETTPQVYQQCLNFKKMLTQRNNQRKN